MTRILRIKTHKKERKKKEISECYLSRRTENDTWVRKNKLAKPISISKRKGRQKTVWRSNYRPENAKINGRWLWLWKKEEGDVMPTDHYTITTTLRWKDQDQTKTKTTNTWWIKYTRTHTFSFKKGWSIQIWRRIHVMNDNVRNLSVFLFVFF
jgi:hypothetical protein